MEGESSTSSGDASGRPRGREAVRTSILEAAADLMAQHGAAASLRDIAAAAGVNLGLIHRHFGNKSDLRRAVLVYLGEAQRARLEAAPGQPSLRALFDALRDDDRNWRIMVRAMMSGEKMTEVQDRFPVVERIVQLATDAADPATHPDEVRFRVARMIATTVGWLVLEPFIVESVGISEPTDRIRDRLIRERARDLGLPE